MTARGAPGASAGSRKPGGDRDPKHPLGDRLHPQGELCGNWIPAGGWDRLCCRIPQPGVSRAWSKFAAIAKGGWGDRGPPPGMEPSSRLAPPGAAGPQLGSGVPRPAWLGPAAAAWLPKALCARVCVRDHVHVCPSVHACLCIRARVFVCTQMHGQEEPCSRGRSLYLTLHPWDCLHETLARPR